VYNYSKLNDSIKKKRSTLNVFIWQTIKNYRFTTFFLKINKFKQNSLIVPFNFKYKIWNKLLKLLKFNKQKNKLCWMENV
jgi:hypothetical protein